MRLTHVRGGGLSGRCQPLAGVRWPEKSGEAAWLGTRGPHWAARRAGATTHTAPTGRHPHSPCGGTRRCFNHREFSSFAVGHGPGR